MFKNLTSDKYKYFPLAQLQMRNVNEKFNFNIIYSFVKN